MSHDAKKNPNMIDQDDITVLIDEATRFTQAGIVASKQARLLLASIAET